MDDGLLYQNGNIKVTKNVFSNGQGRQFVIAGLKSIREERRAKPVWPMIAGIACLGLAALEPLFADSRIVFGAAGAALIMFYVSRKERYFIFVTGPEGEVAAFKTRNEHQWHDVSRSLKRAIALHSEEA